MADYSKFVKGATFAGVDQGIDFTGAGTVYNPFGMAIVTRYMPTGSGWPGEGALLVLKVLTGPFKGMFYYVAEDFKAAPGIGIGTQVKPGQAIGVATGSGRAPGIEAGFADSQGRALQPLQARGSAYPSSGWGAKFNAAVQGSSDTPSGGGGFWNDIKSGVGSAATGNPIGGAVGAAEAAGSLVGLSPKDIPGVAQYDALTGFFGKLTDPAFLFRAGEVIGGAVLILLGGYLLARQIGLAAVPSNPVAGAAVRAVT